MAASESSKLKDLDLSKDEINRIQDAFKKEEFRKLFAEYAEEIADPKNRAIYEAEIQKMENERGMNVKFVNPTPGYVFKSVISGTKTKAFVNICSNDNVDKPTCKSELKQSGRQGLMWSIPHSFAPPREDYDTHKKKCKVFDVVFHPDTLRMSTTNAAFKNMIEGTAIDGLEKQFDVTLEKNTIKYLKMTFKGTPQATVIRTKSAEPPQPVPEDDVLKNFPYPYDNKTTAEKTQENEAKQKNSKAKKDAENKKIEEGPEVPNYSIVHQSDLDYQSFTNTPDKTLQSTRPKNLIISIDLPLLQSAKTIDLDVFEKSLTLNSEKPAAYSLHIDLPYAIDDGNSNAKFDKTKHQLIVTLPVIKDKSTQQVVSPTEQNLIPDNIENGAPLIQVLSDDSESQTENKEMLDDTKENEESSKDAENDFLDDPTEQDEKSIWPTEIQRRVKYLLPEYDYQQDNQTISLTARVKNVSPETLTRTYALTDSRQTATFEFVSTGSGGFPVHYRLMVRLADGLTIATALTTVDVTDDDVCIVLLKNKECRENLWGMIEIGLDADNLEEKSLPTEEALKQEYDALVALCQTEKTVPDDNDRVPPLMNVEENGKEKFAIQIGCSDADDTAGDADWDVDTEDHDLVGEKIEVVHKHKVENLHGILKQRSFSESSIDESSGQVSRENSSEASPENSPRSQESDETERLKRSVSFSEHNDTTTFKSNAAVTTMTVTLKSKRRRQRKRERRQESQRQRYHSTGSECSSDDYEHRSAGSEYSDVDDAFVKPTVCRAPESRLKTTKFEEDLVEEKNKVNRNKDSEEDGAKNNQASKPTSHLDSDELSEPEVDEIQQPEVDEISEPEEEVPKSDSILSWDEKPNVDPEHRTQCAFQFSNNVMFVLDDE